MSAAIRCPDLSGAPDARPSQSAGFVHSFLRMPVFSVPGPLHVGLVDVASGARVRSRTFFDTAWLWKLPGSH